MKNLLMGIVGMLFLLLTTVSILSVYSLGVRKNEVSNAVSEVMLGTVRTYYKYGQTVDETLVIEELKEYLKLRLGADSAKEVEIAICDMEKGILALSVTEEFLLPQGERTEVNVSKVLLLDKAETDDELVQIRFWKGKEIYKIYEIPVGQKLWEPKRPEAANKKWGGWKTKDGELIKLSAQIAKEDTDYYAYFKE